jgi:hypothetical protein
LPTVTSSARRQSVGEMLRVPGAVQLDFAQGRESGVVVDLELWCWWLPTWKAVAEASLRGSPCRIVSVKISTQGVNRSTTYPRHLHGLADETYSSLKRMEVCGGCGWQMRHARGGWLHARCEGKNRKSAGPGQYALPCIKELLNNIPKQLCSHAMKLVVLFGRCAQCVVAWCEKCCCGGGGGSPLWLASDGRLSCAAKS